MISVMLRSAYAQYTPPTPTRRRRDSTRQLSRVGVGGVYWALVTSWI